MIRVFGVIPRAFVAALKCVSNRLWWAARGGRGLEKVRGLAGCWCG